MAELVTSQNNKLIKVKDAPNPIILPSGQGPSAATLSEGTAAKNAGQGVKVPSAFLGINFKNPGIKDFLFMGVVGYIAYKYGRRFFQ